MLSNWLRPVVFFLSWKGISRISVTGNGTIDTCWLPNIREGMRDRHLFGRFDVTSRQLPDTRLHFCSSVWGRRCGRIKKEEKQRLVKKNKRREKTVQSRFKKILKNHVIYLGPALESRLEHGRLDCGTYVLTLDIFWYKCDRLFMFRF